MFAVIFEVNPRPEAWDEYLGHAAALRPELLAIDGFMTNERFASLHRPGWLVSLSIWRDEKALVRWRTHARHHVIQGLGRSSVFADYHLRVGEIVADTEAAAPLPQNRFDATEITPLQAVSLTERRREAGDPPGGPRSPEANDPAGDDFDSITQPGNLLRLRSWPDTAAAEAWVKHLPGRHRIIRIIRDYGMFARAEAPQYFPP